MNEIDELWEKQDPTTITDQQLDKIILMYRKQAADHAAGIKPDKPEKRTLDIASMVKRPAPTEKPDRRGL